MSRAFLVGYSLLCYAVSLVVILASIGFVGGLVVPKTLASGPAGPVLPALAVNVGLVALFGLQHSAMARAAFKRRLARVVPPAAERSTYVLVSSAALAAVMALWQPLPQTLWRVEGPVAWALWAVFGLGWAMVSLSTFLLDHFEFFGLRQAVAHARRRPLPAPAFRTPLLYRVVRHPLMLGLLLAFWAAPHLTLGRLVFAAAMTAYIVVGVAVEERDLVASLGDDYETYRRRVPRLVPRWRPTADAPRAEC